MEASRTVPQYVGLPRLTWDQTVAGMCWNPGEHVSLVGPIGRGKTEAEIKLMEWRRWKVFVSTKRRDETQDELVRQGYRQISDPNEINSDIDSAFFFKAPFPRNVGARALKDYHRGIYSRLLMTLREQMGWTIGLDEIRYLTEFLGLSDEINLLILQGRSEGTSILSLTQRPRHVPLEVYSQSTHMFFWSSPDLSDVRRIGEFVPIPVDRIMGILAAQSKHEMLYVNTVTHEMWQTNTRW